MTKDLFKECGLCIEKTPHTNIEVGKQYHVYGMITKFLDESVANFLVEVNFSMKVRIVLSQEDFPTKFNLLKDRSFEPGIFMITMDHKSGETPLKEGEYSYEGTCTAIVFGKRKDLDA